MFIYTLGRGWHAVAGAASAWKRSAARFALLALPIAACLLMCFPAQQKAGEPQSVSIVPRSTNPSQRAAPRTHMRVDVRMILVPATVTDQFDRPVMDLPIEAFRIYEDEVEQEIVSIFREEGPVSVGFIFDASSSMKKRMDRSIAAVEQFLGSARDGDEFFLIRFSDRPSLVQAFTRDPDAILSALSFVKPDGWTALLDAVYLGVSRMKTARNPRRALFVLTDGSDNSSRYTEREIVSLVRESDVRIYAIGLFERPRFLEKIAMESGGKAYLAHHLKDLPETVDRLANELRNQYILGYYPTNGENDGRYRRVRVSLASSDPPKRLHVVWRHGYYAPID
jgi:VWFA-related protein